MPTLYDYQQKLVDDVYAEWQRVPNVLAVSATGSGKTVVFSHIMNEFPGFALAMAHRSELVSQISLALARNEVRHRIIGQRSTVQNCIQIHMQELGRSYFNPNASCAVAGVDTLIRLDPNTPWLKQVGLWVGDEAHHFTQGSKWHKAVELLPNAKGLGVTATPCRSDGKGLGRHADGLFDTMVQAPGMREIINRGFLTDYRIFAPGSDVDLSTVNVSASGDFSPEPLRAAIHKSHIVGDTVEHYLRIAPGALGVTFCVDIEASHETAAAYRQQGVPAEVVSSKSTDLHRAAMIAKFRRGDIKQLVNVDLFGEGFDLPAISVVSMARPTWSFGLFVQQFGRALRRMDGKQYGIIIDHVANVQRHGLPDAPQNWTLDARERRGRTTSDIIKVRTCPDCTAVYDRVLGPTCPYCRVTAEPAGRSAPAQVDGCLFELSPEVLAKMRGEVESVYGPPKIPYGAEPAVVGAIHKRHKERLEALDDLKHTMSLWAAGMLDIPAAQRRFYLEFGIDVASAQVLNKADAIKLNERILQTAEVKRYG